MNRKNFQEHSSISKYNVKKKVSFFKVFLRLKKKICVAKHCQCLTVTENRVTNYKNMILSAKVFTHKSDDSVGARRGAAPLDLAEVASLFPWPHTSSAERCPLEKAIVSAHLIPIYQIGA